MLGGVLETLTGIGLATSAGLNAYIPLLMLALLGRFTDLIALPSSWQWLENGWTIAILVVLLAIEVVADKIPVVDHVNDVIQTVIRPTSGGLVFGAASGAQTTTVTDPGDFFSSHQWIPVAAGIVISLTVHSVKAAARPVVNVSTAGVGAPIVSVIEDVFSVVTALIAIILPVLIIVVVIAFFVCVWAVIRLRRRRRQRKLAEQIARAQAGAATLPLATPPYTSMPAPMLDPTRRLPPPSDPWSANPG